ncbi:unnamed protein product [Brassica napus]|nr:unnamed protein product [Brassica napus]
MSTAPLSGFFLTSLSPSQSSLKKVSLRSSPTVASLPSSSSSSSSSSSRSVPTLIRNEPVLAAPAPIITPYWSEEMGSESYQEATEALKKLLIEKEELKTVAAAKVEQITAELKTGAPPTRKLSTPWKTLSKASSLSRRRNTKPILLCMVSSPRVRALSIWCLLVRTHVCVHRTFSTSSQEMPSSSVTSPTWFLLLTRSNTVELERPLNTLFCILRWRTLW